MMIDVSVLVQPCIDRSFRNVFFSRIRRRAAHHLLSYYLANKRTLHVRSQGLEIPTLIGEKKEKLKLPTTTITKN